MKKSAKIVGGLFGGLALAACAGYAAMSFSYSDKFLPNTFINGMNVGGLMAEEVEQNLQEMGSCGTFSLIKSDGSREEISLGEIGFRTEFAEDIREIQEGQNQFMWIVTALGEDDYSVAVRTSYDAGRLAGLIRGLKCVSSEAVQAPVDAHIEKTLTGYEIVDAIDGNKLDEKKVEDAIIAALERGETEVDLAAEDCYLKAEMRADDERLVKALANMARFADLEITIDLVGAQETLDYEQIGAWIDMDGDNLKVDTYQVENYVTGLSIEYNTYKTQRQFHTTNAGVITVGDGEVDDTYGFQMDIDATTKAVVDAIESGKSQTVDAEWLIPALTRDSINGDIGETYVEIDLTTQHMWYYRAGELYLDTDIVSGKPNEEQKTPCGVFRVWSKEEDTFLTGTNSTGYSWNAHVDYWMPITWTGVGIHDADWVTTFGGNMLETAGSQGCINTPPAQAGKMFDVMDWDTPVIIYRS